MDSGQKYTEVKYLFSFDEKSEKTHEDLPMYYKEKVISGISYNVNQFQETGDFGFLMDNIIPVTYTFSFDSELFPTISNLHAPLEPCGEDFNTYLDLKNKNRVMEIHPDLVPFIEKTTTELHDDVDYIYEALMDGENPDEHISELINKLKELKKSEGKT
jgi:hypothetical protein